MPNQATFAKDDNKRSKHFWLRTYHDPFDLIPMFKGLAHYAYIKHDKDQKEDCSLDVVHFHVLLTFHSQHTLSSCENVVEKLSDLLQADYNYFLVPLNGSKGDSLAEKYAYLTHKLDRKKHQYSEDDIVSDDKAHWSQILAESRNAELREDGNEMFLLDLFSLSDIKLAKRYGRDFIRNYNSYTDFRCRMLSQYNGNVSLINTLIQEEI